MSNIPTYSVTPNLQLVYVSNIEHSTAFYKFIFKKEPVFISPRYVAFSSSGDALFALWSGGDAPKENVARFSEIGIMLPHGEDVDKLYAEWQEQTTVEINVLKEPYTDVFGRTFLIKDPDGHIIRVCPLD
ncbi:VOC family protein [Bartonella massiliensis]|uniref:VOC family protein n=1 Tax=Bartonella massiliensis TaxID=929795 RepID=UPI00115B545F|nr:VOC family protein [Bartonella massiliensis]